MEKKRVALRVAVQHAAAFLQSVHNVQGRHGGALGMLRVRRAVTDDSLNEGLENATHLLVHDTADTLHSTTACEATDGGLCDAADVLLQRLLLAFRARGRLTLRSSRLLRHLRFVKEKEQKKNIVTRRCMLPTAIMRDHTTL